MTTPIDFEDDLDLNTNPIAINPTKTNVCSLEEDERKQIEKSIRVASNNLRLVPSSNKVSFDDAKITDIPLIAKRVKKEAFKANIVKTPVNLKEAIDEIETYRKETLENPNATLPDVAGFDPETTSEEKLNIFLQVNSLVADIMRLISKLNDRNRQEHDHEKKQYGFLNTTVGNAISSRGIKTFWSNVTALLTRVGGSILGGALGSEGFQKAADALGQQIPGLTGILTTGNEVTQTKKSNELSLLSTKMQADSQKGGDNSSWKQEINQLQGEVRQMMTAAARAN